MNAGQWGPYPDQRGPYKVSKLTPRDREAIRSDIAALRADEPTISKSEIGRRLALKYGVSGSTIYKQI